jgi:DNA repair protein RecO (recombination protein O)
MTSNGVFPIVTRRTKVPSENALGLVLRTTDWSDTSRIATVWTRERGKVRGLAKGGRRLRSGFESALDLLTLCRISLLRKSSGSLHLLTEAQVVRRFPGLSTHLRALYAGYYVAELLADWTEEDDPHPVLFDEALDALSTLAEPGAEPDTVIGPRLARFELVLLRELGYSPMLGNCAVCHSVAGSMGLSFSAAAGGVLCAKCAPQQRDRRVISAVCLTALRALADSGDAWRNPLGVAVGEELRQVLGGYITYVHGRRPRMLAYL